MFLTGVLQAIVVLIQCVFFNVFIRLADLHSDLNGILFACITGVAASFILLIYAGPGKLGLSSMKNWATWVYGFCGLAQFALDIYLVKYISATELSLFSRITIPMAIIMAFIFLKRKPEKYDFIAVFSIIVGAIILLYIQDSSVIKTIIVLVILMSIFWTAEFMATEVHSQSVTANKSGNIKDRARVIGFASFVSSIMFLSVCFIISVFKQNYNLDLPIINSFPSMANYLDSYTIILAILYGVFVTAFTRFCIWSATYKIKTENLLAILVFIPILTYLSEKIISSMFNIELNSILIEGERGTYILIALLLMTFGSAASIIPKVLKNIDRKAGQKWLSAFKQSIKQQDNNYEIQHGAGDSSDYTILQQTLAFYDGDYEKVGKLYNISTDAVKVIIAGNGASCFIDEVSKYVQKVYQNDVVIKDKLTDAKNRIALSMDIAKLIKNNDDFSVILLDLNDFKPVNDTYGHEAGDVVLKETVKRLKTIYKDGVYRLGGDEFVIVTLTLNDKMLKDTKSLIGEQIKYKNLTLSISTSLGVSAFKKDGLTQDELLDFADKNLYIDKKHK
jgi:diguanylate cyclase (GGDEF)-like protein